MLMILATVAWVDYEKFNVMTIMLHDCNCATFA